MSSIRHIAASAALFAGVAIAAPASAVPLAAGPADGVRSTSAVEQVQYRHCRVWSHECGRRWGWGNWRYRRCMRLHGC